MNNWQTKRLGDLFTFKNGLNKGVEFFGYGTPIVNYTDVNKNSYLTTKNVLGLVEVTSSEKINCSANKGDVFFTRTSETLEEIGLSAVLLDDISDCVFSGYVLRGRPIGDELFEKYCAYAFRVPQIRKEIKRKSSMTTRALTSGKFLSEVNFTYPRKLEQQRIVAILEVWDEYLELLNQKILLKEQLKKGLSQHLLRGRKRLPSFTDEWEERSFGEAIAESRIKDEVADPRKRITVRLHLKGVSLRAYRGTEATDSTQYYVRKSGQLIYGKQNIFKGSIGIVPDHLNGYASSQDIPAFDVRDGFNAYFLFCLLSRKNFYEWLENFTNGSGSKRLNPKELMRIKQMMPKIKEQNAIARIMQTAEDEVESLLIRKGLTLSQKKYLLKNLLSGTIRTPENLQLKKAES